MSHIVQIQTEVRDAAAVLLACSRLNLPQPVNGTHNLYAGQVATGLAVRLPGWKFPVVCDTAAGTLAYDNYGGAWGKQAELDKFLQAYAIEKARIEARRRGHAVTEQSLADGSVKLTVQVVGSRHDSSRRIAGKSNAPPDAHGGLRGGQPMKRLHLCSAHYTLPTPVLDISAT